MLKALLKKQLLEVRNFYLSGRRGKASQPGKKARDPKGMMILFLVIYFVIMISLFFLSMGIGHVIIPAGLDWLYFTVTNVIAFLLGVLGSVMSTAQALFRSKDNEFLLAMPIPASRILFVRMISVFLMGLLYESAMMIPSVIYYFIIGHPTFLGVVLSILSIIVMAFLVTAFSVGAGWLVAYISTKLKNQKVILAFLLIIVIGGIYYFQFNSSRFINSIVHNADSIAERLQGWGYPLYAPGLGMTGNIVGFLVFLAITGLFFGLAYFAVTKSFSRIALFKAEEKHTAFRKDKIRASSLSGSLLKREFSRFFASLAYMFNTGFGCMIMLLVAVLVLIKMQDIRMAITNFGAGFPQIEQYLPVAAAGVVSILASFCVISGCSVSMEGKYLWVYQSLPVDPYAIFKAKIKLHTIVTGIPALILVLVLGITIETTIPIFICMVVFVAMFVYLGASFGLQTDLRRPKLGWTNENQAMKTNLNVLVIMLIGLVVPLALGAIYLPLTRVLSPEMYLVILIAACAVLTLLIHRWLAGKGREIFRYLQG